MLQYTWIDSSNQVFEQATNFLLTPKPVVTRGQFLDYENYALIGSHILDSPTYSIWDQARDIEKKMKEIIIHITLEQRIVYIQEYTRSLSLIAVQRCEIRQEYINASSSIASLIILNCEQLIVNQYSWLVSHECSSRLECHNLVVKRLKRTFNILTWLTTDSEWNVCHRLYNITRVIC